MISASPRLNRLPTEERGLTIADFLLPIRVGERMGSRLRHVALVVAGALLIALCAQITIVPAGQTIPLIADFRLHLASSPIPITGQTFAVLLVGGALGFRRGVLAVSLYLVLGLFLPLYAAGASGLDTYVTRSDAGVLIFGSNAGYLLGFLLAAAVTGRLAEIGWDRNIFGAVAAMLIGNVVIYLVGVPWLAILALGPQYAATRWETAAAFGLTPFVVVDAFKLVLAAVAFPAAWWIVGRRAGEG
ncbi:MAG: biotin transport system substrate-specific component [Chloroflexota bacterium]|jgi:biotin transport system substrate-specific component|nr:biotin transport system substrate-specific component [Chloroflexota bacterium]